MVHTKFFFKEIRESHLYSRVPQVAVVVKNPPANAGDIRDIGSIPGSGSSPEEAMATHSGIPAWRILWTEEPGVYRITKGWTQLRTHMYLYSQ